MTKRPLSTYFRSSSFESTWKTNNVGVSNDDQILLPLEATGVYNFTVDWGDDNSDTIIVYNQAEVTHTYSSAGTYTVKITGIINGWKFGFGGDRLKLLTIESWGDLLLGNSGLYFCGCSNLVINTSDELNISNIINLENAFSYCSSLITIDVSSWDVSSVSNFNDMFNGCSSLTTLDVSSWNVSNTNSFSGTFSGCSSLITIAVDNWNIINVVTMSNMFTGVTLTTVVYDAILIAWEAQAVQSNVTAGFGNSKYTGGGVVAVARQALIDDHTWAITDGGIA